MKQHSVTKSKNGKQAPLTPNPSPPRTGARGGIARRSKTLPTLDALLAADGSARDPGTGKTTLYGIFDRLTVAKFPAEFEFVVYGRCSGGSGEHELRIRIESPAGKTIDVRTEAVPVAFGDDASVEVFARIQWDGIAEEGPYRFQLMSGRKSIGRPIVVQVGKS